MPTYALTSPYPNLPYQSKQSSDGAILFVKNAYVGYLIDNNSADLITDVDYPSWHTVPVTSITRSGATATATVADTSTFGSKVIIAGAVQTQYNGEKTITITASTTFTFPVTGTPATPATGTITLQGGKTTVPGIVWLDEYFFVQDAETGDIYNCDTGGAYSSWSTLAYVTPVKEPSKPVYLAKSLNYVVSLKEWDTEFFENAAAPAPGSPLLPTQSAYLKLGCASAGSVVEFDGGIVFMSKRDKDQRSREVHILAGLTPQKISTPAVERILNADDLDTVYGLYLSMAGHQFYVLTLKTSGITISYDFTTKIWWRLTSLTVQTAQSVTNQAGTALTQDNGLATMIIPGHGFSDGDPVLVAGATQTEYNGTQNVYFVDVNTVQFEVDSAAVSPATGTITAAGYTESYFPGVAYANFQNLDLVLHETNGKIYSLDTDIYLDDDAPINLLMRTPKWDAGNTDQKAVSEIRLIGDAVDADVLIRYTNDDYQSWSNYRRQDMSLPGMAVRRLGNTIRRAYEVRHTDDTPLRGEDLEFEFVQGK